MIFQLTSKEIEEMKFYQHQTKDKSVYTKVTCLLMLDRGLSVENVSQCLGINISTVYRYVKSYSAVGLSDFLTTKYDGYWGQLSSIEISLLRLELKRAIYTDAKSVSIWIKDRFGVQYTTSGVVDLLNRIGFTNKKTKEVPCECDAEKQQTFVAELSEVFENTDEKTVIYYADGVHPTHNSRSACAWIEKGEELEQPTVSGGH
jgi:transposase